MKETSKVLRRRRLNSLAGLEKHVPRDTSTPDEQRRAAWLMLTVHAFRAVTRKTDQHALKSAAALRKLIPKSDGCGTCKACKAVAFCSNAFGLKEDPIAVAALCESRMAPSVTVPMRELCGTCGIVIAAATQLAVIEMKW